MFSSTTKRLRWFYQSVEFVGSIFENAGLSFRKKNTTICRRLSGAFSFGHTISIIAGSWSRQAFPNIHCALETRPNNKVHRTFAGDGIIWSLYQKLPDAEIREFEYRWGKKLINKQRSCATRCAWIIYRHCCRNINVSPARRRRRWHRREPRSDAKNETARLSNKEFRGAVSQGGARSIRGAVNHPDGRVVPNFYHSKCKLLKRLWFEILLNFDH